MKGTVILKPLEYTLEAQGEKWHQGDKLKGSLKIKNHSEDVVELNSMHVTVSMGNYKKVKAKDPKAWSLLDKQTVVEKSNLGAGEEKEFSFEFQLKEDCLITDKNGSIYLAFYEGDSLAPVTHMELKVEQKLLTKQILELVENFLRFKVKEIKNEKNKVDIKLIAPTSREMSNIDSLILNISEIENKLHIHYTFNLRALDLASPTMQVEKKVKTAEQVFTSKQYLFYKDSINQDFIVESFKSVLDTVKTKTL